MLGNGILVALAMLSERITAQDFLERRDRGSQPSANTSARRLSDLDPLWDAMNGYGIFVHGVGQARSVHGWLNGSILNDPNQLTWTKDTLTDCSAANYRNSGCSGWAYIQSDWAKPITYNAPELDWDKGWIKGPGDMHNVGLIMRADGNGLNDRVKGMFLLDGDTWHRYWSGVYYDADHNEYMWPDGKDMTGYSPADALAWKCIADNPKDACKPGEGKCWGNDFCWATKDDKITCEAHVGDHGELWTKLFTNNTSSISKYGTMTTQCQWDYPGIDNLGSSAFQGALAAKTTGFYDVAMNLLDGQNIKSHLGLYLENEFDIWFDYGKQEDIKLLYGNLAAVYAQVNSCQDQFANTPDTVSCSAIGWDGETNEAMHILNSQWAACRLADQIARNTQADPPLVVGAKWLSNLVVSRSKWEDAATVKNLFEKIDCCKVRGQIVQAGWSTMEKMAAEHTGLERFGCA